MKLRIAPGLTFGADAATKTYGILAQRRRGKTYTASVIAEEMVAVEQPWVALDPTGAWWGLRASADGKKAGLPVYVFGGQHGDVPLERTAGKLIADLVVDEPSFYVLDFSAFESKEAERQFATDFAERFYRRKGKEPSPIHLFVDEADVFVPQQSPSGDKRMVGAFEAIVRRGGIRGIGTTLISQRSAVVNKNVLEQIDVLIALRTVGPNDRAAIDRYIQAHGSDSERAQLMGSIASLKLGEAWIWEPGSEPALFKRVKIRERRTFNSSATPKAGERRVEPRKLADVDLDALRGRIEATIEKAKADDPKALRKQVAGLKRELAAKNRELAERPTEPVEVEKPVEVPVLANGAVDKLASVVEAMAGVAEGVRMELARVADAKAAVVSARPAPQPARTAPVRRERPPAPPSPGADDDAPLGKQPRKMLQVLVGRHPLRLTRSQWSTFSGYSQRSSSWSQSIGELKDAGLVVETDDREFEATQAAFDLLGADVPAPQTQDEIIATWRRALKGPQAVAFFDAIVAAYPDGLTRDDLAERTGYSKGSSSFSGTLTALRRNKLIREVGGELGASADLFEETYA